jgi:hypothetical protein
VHPHAACCAALTLLLLPLLTSQPLTSQPLQQQWRRLRQL